VAALIYANAAPFLLGSWLRETSMKPTTLIVSAFLLLAAVSSHSFAVVNVRGMSSCSGWLTRGTAEIALWRQAWVIGYLSGRAAATDKDFLTGTDDATIFLWLDNFCRQNPNKDVEDGAAALAAELIWQKGL
jgi:hypothetical protein